MISLLESDGLVGGTARVCGNVCVAYSFSIELAVFCLAVGDVYHSTLTLVFMYGSSTVESIPEALVL